MAILCFCPPDSDPPLSHACVEAIRDLRDELVDVGHCYNIEDLSSSRETASRLVPYTVFSRIVMSNSTGSCHTSAINERSPRYSKVSECERREGENVSAREKEKKGEESIPVAGIV